MERWSAVVLVFLLLPLAASLGAAQAPAQGAQGPVPVKVLEDPAGDAKMTVGGAPASTNGRWAATDLVSLTVTEDVDTIAFLFEAANLHSNPEAPFAEDTLYTATFLVKDMLYQTEVFRQGGTNGGAYQAQLSVFDPGRGQFNAIDFSLTVAPDEANNKFTVPLPRDELLDSNGTAPGPAITLSGFHASAESGPFGGGRGFCVVSNAGCAGFDVLDRMPDSGNSTVRLPILLGITQTGHARLASDAPIRASNGEATTYVFQVQARSMASTKERYALAAVNVPANWEVRLPARTVDIKGNGSILFPVLVTTPFIHAHGTLQAFTLELRSAVDPGTVGRLQVGVRYAQPPQPAGHHNTVWLHNHKASFGAINDAINTALNTPSTQQFMNAEETDPLDDKSLATGSTCEGISPPTQTYCWTIPLSPGLDLGLDFDIQGKGELTVPFHTTLPLNGATLSGQLVYYQAAPPSDFFGSFNVRDDGIVLAHLLPNGGMDLGANGDGQVLKADVLPTKEADYLPYVKGASLELQLRLTGTGAPEFGFFNGGSSVGPTMQPGAAMVLPLNEYHDKVEGIFKAAPTLELAARTAQDRLVNPGKTVLFNLTLTNHGDAGTFALDLTGTHLPWAARIAPLLETVDLASNQSIPLIVKVTVPPDTTQDAQGDVTADLVLSATSTTDLNVRALARLVARVDTQVDHPDDLLAAQGIQDANAPKKTPGLEPLAVLGALAVALMLVRRRR